MKQTITKIYSKEYPKNLILKVTLVLLKFMTTAIFKAQTVLVRW